MPVISIAELKSLFQNGRVPNGTDFEDLIDTLGVEISTDPTFNTVTIQGVGPTQLFLKYDASNKADVKVDSSGGLTIDPSGDIVYLPAKISGFKSDVKSLSTNYTTTDADSGKTLFCGGLSAYTVTIHSTAPVGFSVLIVQVGTGQITIASSGGTIYNRQSHTKTAGQYAAASAIVQYNAGTSPLVIFAGDTSS